MSSAAKAPGTAKSAVPSASLAGSCGELQMIETSRSQATVLHMDNDCFSLFRLLNQFKIGGNAVPKVARSRQGFGDKVYDQVRYALEMAFG